MASETGRLTDLAYVDNADGCHKDGQVVMSILLPLVLVAYSDMECHWLFQKGLNKDARRDVDDILSGAADPVA